MKPLFGVIKQLGFVSRDIDSSIRHFLDVWNIGPWYVVRHAKTPTLYRGTPSEIEISIALSSSFELQFEIIAQHNDAPSVYRDALRNTSGLHVQHIAIWADDFAKSKAEALAKGWVPVLEGSSGPGEACYLMHPSEPMICMEISDRSPLKEHVRRVIRDIALNWDGKDPIREGLPK
jgi:hypothetical protein